jgi:hypothetical protein
MAQPVEAWFAIIERQAIHRGSFGSVRELNAKIRAFVNGWNDRCHPFVWTKTAEQILMKATVRRLQKRATRRLSCSDIPIFGSFLCRVAGFDGARLETAHASVGRLRCAGPR